MTSDYLFIVMLTAIVLWCLYLIYKTKKSRIKKSDYSDTLADVPMADEMVMIEWREFKFPMRYQEFLEIWTNMTDWHKKRLARDTETKMKKGKINFGDVSELRVIKDTTRARVQIHP